MKEEGGVSGSVSSSRLDRQMGLHSNRCSQDSIVLLDSDLSPLSQDHKRVPMHQHNTNLTRHSPVSRSHFSPWARSTRGVSILPCVNSANVPCCDHTDPCKSTTCSGPCTQGMMGHSNDSFKNGYSSVNSGLSHEGCAGDSDRTTQEGCRLILNNDDVDGGYPTGLIDSPDLLLSPGLDSLVDNCLISDDATTTSKDVVEIRLDNISSEPSSDE